MGWLEQLLKLILNARGFAQEQIQQLVIRMFVLMADEEFNQAFLPARDRRQFRDMAWMPAGQMESCNDAASWIALLGTIAMVDERSCWKENRQWLIRMRRLDHTRDTFGLLLKVEKSVDSIMIYKKTISLGRLGQSLLIHENVTVAFVSPGQKREVLA